MNKLNMNDLGFDFTNYKDHANGLRLWLISSLDFHPTSLKKICVEAEIGYQSLCDFINCKIKCMNYKNMNNLRQYVIRLTENDSINMEDVKDEEFFEG